jgi:hypothetical protein
MRSTRFIFALVCVCGVADAELFRHKGNYQKFQINWRAVSDAGRVDAVYPHPLLPGRIVLATSDGLKLSEDSGVSWKPMRADIDSVTGIAFSPYETDHVYLATEDDGVWRTIDNGKTFEQVGTKESGLATDEVAGVFLDPSDREFRTVLAVHGEAGTGISRSSDGGETWQVTAADYHVFSIQFGNGVFVVAAPVKEPDFRCIYYGTAVSDYWYQLLRDVQITGHGLPSLAAPFAFFSTDRGRLYTVFKDQPHAVGPEASAPFVSVGATRGITEDQEIAYAYEPTKLGLIVSTDRFKTHTTQNKGMHLRTFARSGAHVRANANGTVFFAVANRVLYRGPRQEGVHRITELSVAPPFFKFRLEQFNESRAMLDTVVSRLGSSKRVGDHIDDLLVQHRLMQNAAVQTAFAVTARVEGSKPPLKVTVDLSRLGLSAQTPMLDDGQHADGKAGDGIFGATFDLDPRSPRHDRDDWRQTGSGTLGLTVTAHADDGALSGSVALIRILRQVESFTFYSGWELHKLESHGDVACVRTDLPLKASGPAVPCTRLTISNGKWEWHARDKNRNYDISGSYAVSFWIRSDKETKQELMLHFRDDPLYAESIVAKPIPLIASGYTKGGRITSEWQRIVVPLSKLLDGTKGFRPEMFGYFILSGEGPASYDLTRIRFHRTKDELGVRK